MSHPIIAVLGLGAMGLPMATRLGERFSVRGYDISAERLALGGEGRPHPRRQRPGSGDRRRRRPSCRAQQGAARRGSLRHGRGRRCARAGRGRRAHLDGRHRRRPRGGRPTGASEAAPGRRADLRRSGQSRQGGSAGNGRRRRCRLHGRPAGAGTVGVHPGADRPEGRGRPGDEDRQPALVRRAHCRRRRGPGPGRSPGPGPDRCLEDPDGRCARRPSCSATAGRACCRPTTRAEPR